MKYEKPTLSVEQQVDQLRQRGMVGDPDVMRRCLASVNYYRLSAYWHPFRVAGREAFQTGTEFSRVWETYTFDRELRLLVMDAIERIEIATRTLLVERHTAHFGPFGYATRPSSLPHLAGEQRQRFFESLRKDISHSRETFVKHYRDKYTGESKLPLWMATELLTFGAMLTLFKGCPESVRQEIAERLGVDEKVWTSWLVALNTVRNICAHHARLWNRELGTAPMIPRRRKHPQWHEPYSLDARRPFAILTVANYCLGRMSPDWGWAKRWRFLLESHPRIHRRSLGVPPAWRSSSLWRDAA